MHHPLSLMGFSGDDAFWYVVAGAAVAFGGALVYSARRAIRWLAQRLKASFTEWFGEAVDEHVEPKFDALRKETLAVAAQVKKDLKAHTDEEGDIVRMVIREENATILDQLESHILHDDRVMAAAGDALVQGQAELMRQMTANHDESMDAIGQHVKDDEAAFARIEKKLDPKSS